jgi:hypothetical protein
LIYYYILKVYIRIPDYRREKDDGFSKDKANKILFSLFINLVRLSNFTHKPQFKRYKYISSLPTGPYKSVQIVMAEIRELCGEEYMNKLEKQYYQQYRDIAELSG